MDVVPPVVAAEVIAAQAEVAVTEVAELDASVVVLVIAGSVLRSTDPSASVKLLDKPMTYTLENLTL